MENKNQFEQFAAKAAAADAHNEEIRTSRIGGLGGSDAAMVLRVGREGMAALTNTDMARLAVMMGMSEPENFGGNAYTNAGHLFEDYIEQNICKIAANKTNTPYERERLMEAKFSRQFRTFAHADFTVTKKNTKVIECKYVTAKPTSDVLKEYMPQFQWYYMLGAESVWLCHGWGKVEPFEVEDIKCIKVQHDQEMIGAMLRGIQTLSSAIENGWKPIIPDKVQADAMPITCQRAFLILEKVRNERAKLDEQEAEAKVVLLEYMTDFGYSSILSEEHTLSITKAGTSRTFDAKAFLKAHPEFDIDEFYKTASRKASLTFK